ncbi:MAG: HNH endonuclease [Candidatus Hodarchaeota archaeon]
MKEKKLKLTIELVPKSLWGFSIYRYYKNNNQLGKWKEIKDELFEREGRECWICGDKRRRLEAHEFWEYDDIKHIQTLAAIHHLCFLCHKIKHIGRTFTKNGRRELAEIGLTPDDIIRHFCEVNQCPISDFQQHASKAKRIWNERNKFTWKQDLGNYEPGHSL